MKLMFHLFFVGCIY